jgi:transposase-like protein
MKPLSFGSQKNVGLTLASVKSFWEEDARNFVLKNVRKRIEGLLRVEFRQAVGAGMYQRTEKRSAQRNGYYSRGLMTLYGWLEQIKIPRLRHGGWRSLVFDRYCRRTGALDRLILEGFLLGHSTRKTVRQFRRFMGASISPQAVSNIVKALEDEVNAYHRRSLGDVYKIIYLDGLWIKIARPVKVKKVLLVAYGIRQDGSRELLDFMLALSESEASWWGFLSALKGRGLKGEQLEACVHDGCAGLIKALTALYPRVKRQWCVFHKLSDISHNLRDRKHRSQIAKDAAAIYEAETEKELRERLRAFQAKWRESEPKAVRCFVKKIDQTLIYREYDEPLKTLIKTNNLIERQLEELQRRIKPFRKFNNARSVERIVYGIIAYVLDTQWKEKPSQFYTINFT